MTFSYLDSSLGIKPVIQKLPRHIQEKWVNRVVSYKKGNSVLFPPFAEFVRFIGEMSVIRNDPGLIYEMPKPTSHTQRNVNRNRTVSVTTRKTNTAFENPKDTTQGCLLHRGAKHTINECTAFQTRSLENRKTLLRNHNLCLRCCETSDCFAKKCHSKI